MIIAASLLILSMIGKMFVFKKMHENPWLALIPFYSDYILFQKIWNTDMFEVSFGMIVGACTAILVAGLLPHNNIQFVITAFALLCTFIYLCVQYNLCSRLSKAFGHGMLFTVGLTLCNAIFLPILGLDDSQYALN